MNEFIKWLTDIISQLGHWGYAIMALIAFLEAMPLVGWLVPGLVVLIFGGFLVAENVLNFFDLVVIFAIFTLLGDMVAFAWGRRFTGSFKKEHKIMKESYLIKAQDFIKQRGVSGIVFGRFIAPVRSTLYFVLGIIKMPWLRFIIPAAISSLIFTCFYVSLGYLAGSAWHTIEDWSGRLALALAGAVIILLILWWFKNFLVKQGKQLAELISAACKTFFIWYQTRVWWLKFSQKFSIFSQLIVRVSNPNNFFGLSASALWLLNILFFGLVVCFGVLVNDTTNALVGLDYRLQAFIRLFSEPHLATVFFLITMLASYYFILSLVILFSIWLIWQKRKSYIVGLWLGVGGAFLTGSLIKFIVARPRPIPIFFSENSHSFPSLHAAMAVALLVYLAYYAVRVYPRWSRNISIVLVASLFVILIGFSRLYLGVHYLSDVIGGYMVGGFWFIVAIIAQRYYQNIDKPKNTPKVLQFGMLGGMLILILGIYLSQVFKPNAVNSGFYRSLDLTLNQSVTLTKANNFSSDLLVTENLRGGRRRAVNFIFNTDLNTLNRVLKTGGWTKRLEPTLSSVISRGVNTLFNKPYPNAPLRSRFWHNEPNSLTFTKNVLQNKDYDTYVLRLWPIIGLAETGQQKFIAELAVNREFSWSDIFKQEILDPATKTLLNDLMTSSNFYSLETQIALINLGEELDEEFTVEVYTINLR